MEDKTVSKRRKDKHSDNDNDRREKKVTRRRRTRSRSYEDREKGSRRKRKPSRSMSPRVAVKQEKRREDVPNDLSTKKNVPERKAKDTDMLNTRTGGAYIPPARLRMMQAQITDKSSVAYQRLAWEALKKSIHGHINKINVGNIGIIIKELLKENIVRGRGLLCRSVIQAQAASPTFTNVYAALVAAVNSRFPNIGELLLKRLVIQFKRGFKRNDKSTCISSASFIAHLVNQRVAHEILALELLTLLVESPTDDSVEVAIAFLKECGQKLTEVSSKGVNAIFEMLRNILHEGQLDKRVQYMIEVMFQVWKDGFKDHPALIEELELVPEEEQFTHLLMLDDATDPQDILNVFKFDDKYEENEQKYKTLSKEILGSDAESGEEDGSEESGSGDSEEEEEQEGEQKGMTIIDNTETNLVALRRTIYLTINSSLDFEECAHKLMKMQLKPGQEVELCHMFLDCCAEQRTYEKFYGLLAQRFCNINRIYIGPFEEIFKDSYSTAHRLDTNRLRNVSKFFAHLLFTDSISWEVMECVKLNEEDTTSSSRIYIKILFQELAEYMGLKKLNDRLKDPTLQSAFSGIFPRDNPKNTRFSINFFTSIGLGGLTDELREHLKQMPKNIPAPVTDINVESESSSSSSSSDSSSESSSSDSEEDNEKKKKQNNKSAEKTKSKYSGDTLEAEATGNDKSDKNQRWGHDGFYETYGETARRHDNRPERSNLNNFTRPRDQRRDGHEGQQDHERGNKVERNNRNMYERQNNRNTLNSDDIRGHHIDSDKRWQDRERHYEKSRNITEINSNARNSKDNNRFDRSVRDRSDREEKRWDADTGSKTDNLTDSKRQDRNQRRDRDHDVTKDDSEREKARDRNNKLRSDSRNEEDDRARDRNSDRENKKKEQDRYDRARKDHQNKNDDRTRERYSEKNNKDKEYDRNERVPVYDQNKNDKIRDNKSEREKGDKVHDKSNRFNESDLNKDDNKVRDRNSEREKRNTDQNRNLKVREDDKSSKDIRSYDRERDKKKKIGEKKGESHVTDQNKGKKTEDSSYGNIRDKDAKRDKKVSRSTENRDRKGRNNTNKDKQKDSSDEEDPKHREKQVKSKNKLENESKSKEIKERNEREDESRKTKKKRDRGGRSKKKNKHRRDHSDKESLSSDSTANDSSSSDSSSSESEIEPTGGRYWDAFDIEKPINKDEEEYNKTPEIKEKRHNKRRER